MTSQNYIPKIERLHQGEPILAAIGSHPWENKVTFNPACAFVSHREELDAIISSLPFDDRSKKTLRAEEALCFLLYRAQGEKTPSYDYTRSSMGLAILSYDLRLLFRFPEPVILPDADYDNLGVEDGRITKVDDRYMLFYTAYSSSQPHNIIRIAIASTKNFFRWEKHGLLKGEFNTIDNKNAMLFEQTMNGKFVMLHRPMTGEHAMAIHWAESSDVFGTWTSQGALMKPIPNPAFIDTWIGGGAPPLKVSENSYLVLYHIGNRKADMTREYDLGIALADFSKKDIITKRHEPFMRPETPSETTGDAELGVNNVLFICGAYLYKGYLYFPYAGADSVVCGGRIRKDELDKYLR